MGAPLIAKLGKDLEPGDRLSLTGETVLEVQVTGEHVDVITTTPRRVPKRFGFGQVVFLWKDSDLPAQTLLEYRKKKLAGNAVQT